MENPISDFISKIFKDPHQVQDFATRLEVLEVASVKDLEFLEE
jgi:hypothetical protein